MLNNMGERKRTEDRIEAMFGEVVRQHRKRRGMSQEKFAAEIGVSFSTVSRWENAHNEPSQLSWRAVQELDGSELEQLLADVQRED